MKKRLPSRGGEIWWPVTSYLADGMSKKSEGFTPGRLMESGGNGGETEVTELEMQGFTSALSVLPPL